MNLISKALLFAFIAAIGNAIFVYGQKKSIPHSNPFIFLALALTVCIILLAASTLFFPLPDFKAYVSSNLKAILITAVGLFITYLGFYLLYSRFGASYYILYAILSIITTSIIVGVLIFKENFNTYYLFSIVCGILTIILFFYGQKSGR